MKKIDFKKCTEEELWKLVAFPSVEKLCQGEGRQEIYPEFIKLLKK